MAGMEESGQGDGVAGVWVEFAAAADARECLCDDVAGQHQWAALCDDVAGQHQWAELCDDVAGQHQWAELCDDVAGQHQWAELCDEFAARHADVHRGDLRAALRAELPPVRFDETREGLRGRGVDWGGDPRHTPWCVWYRTPPPSPGGVADAAFAALYDHAGQDDGADKLSDTLGGTYNSMILGASFRSPGLNSPASFRAPASFRVPRSHLSPRNAGSTGSHLSAGPFSSFRRPQGAASTEGAPLLRALSASVRWFRMYFWLRTLLSAGVKTDADWAEARAAFRARYPLMKGGDLIGDAAAAALGAVRSQADWDAARAAFRGRHPEHALAAVDDGLSEKGAAGCRAQLGNAPTHIMGVCFAAAPAGAPPAVGAAGDGESPPEGVALAPAGAPPPAPLPARHVGKAFFCILRRSPPPADGTDGAVAADTAPLTGEVAAAAEEAAAAAAAARRREADRRRGTQRRKGLNFVPTEQPGNMYHDTSGAPSGPGSPLITGPLDFGLPAGTGNSPKKDPKKSPKKKKK
eukprot:gene24139-30162_t